MIAQIESILYPFVVKFNEYLSNYILVTLLVGVGLWYTVKTRFVQIRCFKEGLRNSFGGLSLFGEKNENSISPFQALTTAIAAQVGTGNIVGASAAILVGGPGAIFVAVCLCFFAFSSILCWNFFGKINAVYLFSKKHTQKAVLVYTLLSLGFVMLGSLVSSDFVWELTDMFNNLMVVPNVLALFALTNRVIRQAK
ncbi:MAG: alanine:cation symporter family protein [Elusimicrobiaceae bacterium]|nr:alanine:cation symporter family protein [Elusimicrobiaceae bacterium]